MLQGFAYVTFSSLVGLQRALQLNGTELKGQAISVAVAHQEVPEGQTEAFVLNIPPTADSSGLEALFAVCGPIKSLRLPLDKDTSQLRVGLPCLVLQLQFSSYMTSLLQVCKLNPVLQILHLILKCLRL